MRKRKGWRGIAAYGGRGQRDGCFGQHAQALGGRARTRLGRRSGVCGPCVPCNTLHYDILWCRKHCRVGYQLRAPAMIFVGATRHARMPWHCLKPGTLMRLPQPRSSTTLATAWPAAARCALMGCATSTARRASLSSLTRPAVKVAWVWGQRFWHEVKGMGTTAVWDIQRKGLRRVMWEITPVQWRRPTEEAALRGVARLQQAGR